MSIELETFLSKDENRTSNESILNNRLAYDLKLAAALAGYHLSIFTPEVDRDGFDIVLDDKDILRKFQVKTVLKSSRTSRWDIHRTILRPDFRVCERIGFESSPEGTGVQGGVILMELEPDDTDIKVTYFYTDIFVISALEIGAFNKQPKIRLDIGKFIAALQRGTSHQKIPVSKSLFLKVKSPESLLSLMGFHCRKYYSLMDDVLRLNDSHFLTNAKRSNSIPTNVIEEMIYEKLNNLCDGIVK